MKDAAAREHDRTETDAAGHGLRVPFSGEGGGRLSSEGNARWPSTRRRLAALVAVKLALDLLFVGAFALYAHDAAYRRGFDGALEHADGRGARGWVVDLERPGADVEVQLFLNGEFAASSVARGPRADESGRASQDDGRRHFAFEFRRSGEYEARVYAVREGRGGARRTLQQVGGPLNFSWK